MITLDGKVVKCGKCGLSKYVQLRVFGEFTKEDAKNVKYTNRILSCGGPDIGPHVPWHIDIQPNQSVKRIAKSANTRRQPRRIVRSR
jgi:hypothetical protein